MDRGITLAAGVPESADEDEEPALAVVVMVIVSSELEKILAVGLFDSGRLVTTADPLPPPEFLDKFLLSR